MAWETRLMRRLTEPTRDDQSLVARSITLTHGLVNPKSLAECVERLGGESPLLSSRSRASTAASPTQEDGEPDPPEWACRAARPTENECSNPTTSGQVEALARRIFVLLA